jgi:hypothetical protein
MSNCLNCGDMVAIPAFVQMSESTLKPEIFIHWLCFTNPPGFQRLSIARFIKRDKSGLDGELGDLNRSSWIEAPADWARAVDIQVLGAANLHRFFDFADQVFGVSDGCCGDVGNAVRQGDGGEVFFGTSFPQAARPAGVVIVEAPTGVALERWTPVFI